MTFDEFKQEVIDNIKVFLPVEYQDASVSIQDVIKNNDTHLSGLTIRKEDTGIAPTLYLEDFYNQVESGEHSLNGVLARIADTYDMAMNNDISKQAMGLVENITDYDATKDKIIPRVVNRESNEERLKSLPHKEIGNDLAVTYHVDLGKDHDGQMSVAISNEMMDRYGVSVEDLHEQACKNMEEISPSTFMGIEEVLASMMIPGYASMSLEEKNDALENLGMPPMEDGKSYMYVLSNESKVFGASELLDTKTLDTIQEQVGEFYILPSSVHEVLIVPKQDDMKLSDLEAMVQEVNSTQVAPNEVLSDHVYEYDKDTKEIFRADQKEEHEKAKLEAKEEKAPIKEEKKERPSVRAKLEEKKQEAKELNKENKEKAKDVAKDASKKTKPRKGDAL